MSTEIASLYATIGADTSPLQQGLKGAREGLGGMADQLKGLSGLFGAAFPLSIVGILGAGVKAASDSQSAIAQLDAVLKSTTPTIQAATASQGHWVTITAASGPHADQLRAKLETLTARLHDQQAAWGRTKTHTESAALAMSRTQAEIAKINNELGVGKEGQKVWVNGQIQVAQVSHMTREALIGMAEGWETNTRFSKETVLAGESMLLTFTNIGKNVFPEATRTVLDMSQALGQDTKSSAMQLGKALNDPIAGITALRRVGVSFTDAQEKMIKSLVAAGKTEQAQKLILQELNTEFGGSATAAGETFAGKLDILNHAVGNLLEGIGNALLPTLTSLVDWFSQIAFNIANTVDPSLLQLGVVFGIVLVAAGPVLAILGAFLSPLGLIVGAVALVVKAFQDNFGGIQDIIKNVWTQIQAPLADLKAGIEGFWKTLFPSSADIKAPKLIAKPNQGPKGAEEGEFAQFTRAPGQTGEVPGFLQNLIEAVKTHGPKIIEALGDILSKAGKGLFDFIGNALNDFFKAGGTFWTVVLGVKELAGKALGTLFSLGGNLFKGIGDGLTEFFGEKGGFSTALAGVKETAQKVLGGFMAFGEIVWKAIADTLAGFFKEGGPFETAIKPLKTIWDKISAGISAAFSGIVNIILEPFKSVIRWIGDLLIKAGSLGGVFSNLTGIGTSLKAAAGGSDSGGNGSPTPTPGAPAGPAKMPPSPFPHKAGGGNVSAGKGYLVGEMGPELFMPGRTGTIIPTGALASALSGGNGKGSMVIQQLVLNGVQDVRGLYDALEREAGIRNKTLGAAKR